VFFYGLSEKDEMAVDIDQGKTLVVRLTGRTAADDEGEIKLFFELNGQPRPMRFAKAGLEGVKKARAKAEDGNPRHIAAPMPGAIATVAVKVGQRVHKGNPLVSIEAMKMETALTADRDGVIAKVLVSPGDRVEPKDLLLVLEDA
jgi:pyruvate carboxylase